MQKKISKQLLEKLIVEELSKLLEQDRRGPSFGPTLYSKPRPNQTANTRQDTPLTTPEPGVTIKSLDQRALSILKFFVREGVQPGTPEAVVIGGMQHLLHIFENYKRAPALIPQKPSIEQLQAADRELKNTAVQNKIKELLTTMRFTNSQISAFLESLNKKDTDEKNNNQQTSETPPPAQKPAGQVSPRPFKPVTGQVTPPDSLLPKNS